MKKPSVNTLSRVFDNPREARRVFEMSRAELENTGPGRDMLMSCYNPPKTYVLRLHCLNALDSGLHGAESMETTNGEYAEYLNTGDTYADTVIYWRGSYRVQSVGDFVETIERKSVHFK